MIYELKNEKQVLKSVCEIMIRRKKAKIYLNRDIYRLFVFWFHNKNVNYVEIIK